MKPLYLIAMGLLSLNLIAQPSVRNPAGDGFDEAKYRKIAYERKIPPQDVEGYIRAERSKYLLQQHPELAQPKKEKVTMVNLSKYSNQFIQTNYCANSDFSQLDYSNWTGDVASNCSVGTQYPVASWLGTGINGNNGMPIITNTDPCNATTVSTDRHVVMNLQPGALTTNAAFAFNNGYDPSCCNGSTMFYDLPMVPPGETSSLRIGSAYPNYTCEKVVYALTPSSAASLFTYKYAVVINDGGHPLGEQPAFSFALKDGNGVVLSGGTNPCFIYNVDATAALTDTTFIQNYFNNPCWNSGGGSTYYRKWRPVTVDLSAYIGQTIYAEFQAIDCPWSGHFCYAYISAKCVPVQGHVSMCSSSNTQILYAPGYFASYQWYGPNNTTPIAGATADTLAITNGTVGDVYTVDCITWQGCTTKVNVTLQNSALDITYFNTGMNGTFYGADTLSMCSGNSMTLVASGANSYTWSASAGLSSNDTVMVTPGGTTLTYSVSGTTSTGCVDTAVVVFALDTSGCVWPGDADENLQVDNFDLFPVGVKWGVAGAARSFVSSAWYGYPCADWSDTLQNGINTKYTDCNGNGTVEFGDTLPVYVNYNATHAFKSMAQSQGVNPDIYLQFNKTLYFPGDTVVADVYLGSSSSQLANVYGAAFTIDYDESNTLAGTEKFYFMNSWMGNVNQQFIKLEKLFGAAGYVDASQVRITHSTVNGFGKIATLKYKLKSVVNGNGWLYFNTNSAVMSDDQGQLTNLNAGTDSVAVAVNGIGVAQHKAISHLIVFPNPSSGEISIQSSDRIDEVKVVDVLGKTLGVQRPAAKKCTLLFEETGVYFIQVKTGETSIVKKLVVDR